MQGISLTLSALVGMLWEHAAQRVVLSLIISSFVSTQVERESVAPRCLLALAVEELVALMNRMRIDTTTDY